MTKLNFSKSACALSIISALFVWLFINLTFRNITACVDCKMWVPIMFGIFLLVFVILRFVSLFFLIKNLTNSKKWSIIVVLIVVSLLVAFFVQSFLIHSGDIGLVSGLKSFLNVMFLVFLIISIVLCVVSLIKSHKGVKKSS